jgi:hypothetical protein
LRTSCQVHMLQGPHIKLCRDTPRIEGVFNSRSTDGNT